MPPCQNPHLSLLWQTDPKSAIQECRMAMIQADGKINKAAKILGVTRMTLHRWIKQYRAIKA